MTGFELKDFMEAVGPTASLIFASWIFLSFLQARYSAAYSRYRELIQEYREHGQRDKSHQQSIARQIPLYKQRCEQMRTATNVGVVAAIVLIAAVMAAGLQVVLPDLAAFKYIGALAALVGLALVIIAAVYVVRENTLIQHAIDDEISDLPDHVRR
jgi:uncharacterized membrane protein YraQ (UPF0718 family)